MALRDTNDSTGDFMLPSQTNLPRSQGGQNGSSFSESCCDPFAVGARRLFCGDSDSSNDVMQPARQRRRGNDDSGIGINNTALDGQKLLAQEMSKLSITERELIMEDIHGVNSFPVPAIVDTDRGTLAAADSNRTQQTSEWVDSHLRDVEHKLTHMPQQQTYALDKAAFLSSRHAKSTKLRIMFLRASDWDSTEASRRLCKHFEVKLALFGLDKLVHDVQFDDLPHDAQDSLRSGSYFCSHRCKDSAGRLIMLANYSQWRYKTVKSHAQASWWGVINCLSRLSPETHQKGLVNIVFARNPTATPKMLSSAFRALFITYDMESCLPIRGRGTHFCFEDQTWFQPFFVTFLSAAPRGVRLRVKTHFGSPLETTYALKSYGISTERKIEADGDTGMDEAAGDEQYLAFPIDEGGEIRNDVIEEYIQFSRQNPCSLLSSSWSMDGASQRNTAGPTSSFPASIVPISQSDALASLKDGGFGEDSIMVDPTDASVAELMAVSPPAPSIILPSITPTGTATTGVVPIAADILLGRGATYRFTPGNLYMKKLLEQHKAAYDAATSRAEKTAISLLILKDIKSRGGRFLKRTTGVASRRNKRSDKPSNTVSEMGQKGDDGDVDTEDEWIEISDNLAREKIAMGFRNLSRKTRSVATAAASTAAAPS